MTDSKTKRLIEKSIDGSISSKENSILCQIIDGSSSAKREFFLRKELELIVEEKEYFLLKHKLHLAYKYSSEKQSNDYSKSTGRDDIKKYLYYAAAFTGIAMGGWLSSTLFNREIDPTKLYFKNFAPYPATQLSRSSNEHSMDSILFRAILAYQHGDYNSATEDFSQFILTNPEALTARFYLGVTYMELLEFESARTNLMIVAESNSLFKEQALWYCGLSYLGELRIDDAKTIFNKLSGNDTPLSQKANELLKELSDK